MLAVKRALRILAGLLLFNVGTGIVLAQFERFMMKPYRVASSAMEPALHCGSSGPGCEGGTSDRIFALRNAPSWTPSRGDIVVFRTPELAYVKCGAGGTFVKRLIGLPGETVSERRGVVSIDGKRLEEPYVERARRSKGGTWRVPRGEYFFLGDNRTQSCDSREWGSVPRRNLVGPVVARYWPFDRIGLL